VLTADDSGVLPPTIHWPSLHDSVVVPDGREGAVIGFYRRDDESVLVSFQLGDFGEFLTTDVRPPA
jgi:hypothetical protein